MNELFLFLEVMDEMWKGKFSENYYLCVVIIYFVIVVNIFKFFVIVNIFY